MSTLLFCYLELDGVAYSVGIGAFHVLPKYGNTQVSVFVYSLYVRVLANVAEFHFY